MTPEGKVKAKITAFLKSKAPYVWYFMPQGTVMGRAGIPDYVGCCDGRLFGIEAKAGNGKQTVLQQHEAARIREAGGEYFLINEQNMDEEFARFEKMFPYNALIRAAEKEAYGEYVC